MHTDDLNEPVTALATRTRAYLVKIAGQGAPVTYQFVAKALDISPPNTIHQLTIALETLIEQDAASGRPLITALVISKARGGLPAPGFFDCAHRVGQFDGDMSETNCVAFFTAEFAAAVEHWGAASGVLD